LFDPAILERIADSAEITPHDPILEVGPGLGALTRVLAQRTDRVVAVELDNRFIPILRYELAFFPHVELIHGDILEQQMPDLFDRPYKVIANVPYYITGAILRHLLSAEIKPKSMTLTVQKEVAERITALPNAMSLMAVSVQFYGTAKLVGNIAAGAFWPRPKVASSIVQIDVSPQWADVDELLFFRVAKAGFSQKRKQLKNNMQQLGLEKQGVLAVLGSAEIDPKRRAETLSIDEWVALTRAFTAFKNGRSPAKIAL
jgi:16S rRNA (adenine1518-N6/adenine1519-N6)-dimethyltransferase